MGAFDFITKPSGAISLDLYKIKEQLIERVIAAGLSRAQKPEAAVKESSIPERPALAGFETFCRARGPPVEVAMNTACLADFAFGLSNPAKAGRLHRFTCRQTQPFVTYSGQRSGKR
jgi:chemotaxis response regulator CheB